LRGRGITLACLRQTPPQSELRDEIEPRGKSGLGRRPGRRERDDLPIAGDRLVQMPAREVFGCRIRRLLDGELRVAGVVTCQTPCFSSPRRIWAVLVLYAYAMAWARAMFKRNATSAGVSRLNFSMFTINRSIGTLSRRGWTNIAPSDRPTRIRTISAANHETDRVLRMMRRPSQLIAVGCVG